MSGHGGARSGAGRPKGAASRFNDEARAKAAAEGITPLEYMLKLLRDERQSQEVRIDVAKAAAPYLHARLAAVEHSGGLSLSHEEMLDELDGSREGDQASSKG
jgi:hypothetical protein